MAPLGQYFNFFPRRRRCFGGEGGVCRGSFPVIAVAMSQLCHGHRLGGRFRENSAKPGEPKASTSVSGNQRPRDPARNFGPATHGEVGFAPRQSSLPSWVERKSLCPAMASPSHAGECAGQRGAGRPFLAGRGDTELRSAFDSLHHWPCEATSHGAAWTLRKRKPWGRDSTVSSR
jgi:hypothetical protein